MIVSIQAEWKTFTIVIAPAGEGNVCFGCIERLNVRIFTLSVVFDS